MKTKVLISGFIVLVLFLHYLFLTGHFDRNCDKELFNATGLEELTFLETGTFGESETYWMLVAIPDQKIGIRISISQATTSFQTLVPIFT